MEENKLPFALEFPVKVGMVSVSFFVYENLYLKGQACASFPHDHSDYELFYTDTGHGIQEIEGVCYPYTAKDLLLLKPGEYHHQSASTLADQTARYSLRFSLKPLSKSAGAEEKRGHIAMLSLLSKIRLLHDSEGILQPHLERLRLELKEKKQGYYDCVRAVCGLLLTDIIRLSQIDTSAVFPSEELRHSSYFRNQIERFLRHKYPEKVTLDDLALALRVSSRQASRLVRRAFGLSFIEKLTRVRIEQAKFLLESTETPLEEIAESCGFQSYSYFAACFHAQTGMTPTAFRKKEPM